MRPISERVLSSFLPNLRNIDGWGIAYLRHSKTDSITLGRRPQLASFLLRGVELQQTSMPIVYPREDITNLATFFTLERCREFRHIRKRPFNAVLVWAMRVRPDPL